MRRMITALCLVLAAAPTASAEVTRVWITSRSVVADGRAFGSTGPYERLAGRIQFAVDPAHARNMPIADLELAPRATDKRVYFTADLFVLQPVDPSRGNGALLFEVANRGRKGLLQWFNRAPASNNPTTAADMGDGYLMREGYTLVWIGWQFDVAAPFLSIDAPRADLRGKPDVVRMTFIADEAAAEASPADLPAYRPADLRDPSATLSVRDRFWQTATPIARERWRFVSTGPRPRLSLDGGFEPGRVYELSYRSLDAQVAGVGLAAIRDAASAFRYNEGMPVRGRTAYVFGQSQSGRFLRLFLLQGFNVDERDRRVFDAVWPHVAGAGLGSFNERFAMPGYSSFPATRPPFTDSAPAGSGGGILTPYAPDHLPKVIHTNSPVEYWGQGRAAALTHTTSDGASDLPMLDTVRRYLLAGAQHGEGAFPPRAGAGQQPGNPTMQRPVLRALLRSLHSWVTTGAAPPASRYPRFADKTLTPVAGVRFPAIPGVADPRTIEGPGSVAAGRFTELPFLVPQVDADGNDLAGIRMPEVAVPLATTTGWNFRSERAGNPATILALAGAYMPFPRTRADRDARRDPRRAIEERYRDRADYLRRIRSAADALVKDGFLLGEDVDGVVERAGQHWDFATGAAPAK